MAKIQRTNQPKQNIQKGMGSPQSGFPGDSTNRQGPRQSAKGDHMGSGFTGLKGGTSHGNTGSQSANSHPAIPVGGHYSTISSGDKK